jgi:hypothetical protein
MEGVIRASLVLTLEKDIALGIYAKAMNGGSRSLPHLYWSWIRHVAMEEGVTLPQSGSATDSLTEEEAKRLASVLRAKAKKIRKGLAVRDAASYVQQIDKQWFPTTDEGKEAGTLGADFDDPDDMDETANFFESSGGVTLRY